MEAKKAPSDGVLPTIDQKIKSLFDKVTKIKARLQPTEFKKIVTLTMMSKSGKITKEQLYGAVTKVMVAEINRLKAEGAPPPPAAAAKAEKAAAAAAKAAAKAQRTKAAAEAEERAREAEAEAAEGLLAHSTPRRTVLTHTTPSTVQNRSPRLLWSSTATSRAG